MIYVNGDLLPDDAAHLSALDRGFTLGDGVFETMRAIGGHVFRLEQHLARLQCGAAVLHIPFPGLDLLDSIEQVLLACGLRDAIVRLTLSRGVARARGLLPADENPTVVISAVPFVGLPLAHYEAGFRAITSNVRRNDASPVSRIKSCNYLDNILARLEAAEQDADEALMLNTRGSLAGGSASNLFLVTGGALVTPSVESGVLAGITRGVVLQLATESGEAVQDRAVAPDELHRCREAFLTNTVIGVMPLAAVDGRPVGDGPPGPLTLRLMAAYENELRQL